MERQRLGLLDLILCEVLQGVQDDRDALRVQGELEKLEIHSTGGMALAFAQLKTIGDYERRAIRFAGPSTV